MLWKQNKPGQRALMWCWGNSASLEREAGKSEKTLCYELKPCEDLQKDLQRRNKQRGLRHKWVWRVPGTESQSVELGRSKNGGSVVADEFRDASQSQIIQGLRCLRKKRRFYSRHSRKPLERLKVNLLKD